MEEHVDNPFDGSSFSSRFADEKGVDGAEELLEDCWFFGNLRNGRSSSTRRTIMRRNSGYCPSSSSSSITNASVIRRSSSSMKRLVSPSLIRSPSLPPPPMPLPGELEEPTKQREINNNYYKSTPASNLIRPPSLLPCIGSWELLNDAEEGDFSLSKLIRQASVNSTNDLPPRHTLKGTGPRSSAPRHHQISKKPDQEEEGIDKEGYNQVNCEHGDQTKMSIKIEQQVQEFKDLSFKFNKKSLKPSAVTKSSSCEEKVRRSAMSEAWRPGQSSSACPIPSWVDKTKRSSAPQDMKEQIKFWARAVAANVR